jgi:2-dehydro-3-deoxygluconokinase
VDVMIGNEEDFIAGLGISVESVDEQLLDLEVESFARMIETAAELYPNLRVIATTLRAAKTATVNDWGAIAWAREVGFAEAMHRPDLEILDRVGGGDSFASGLTYGLLMGRTLDDAVELGAAHGALAMTTPGDTSMATLDMVTKLAAGGGARVER